MTFMYKQNLSSVTVCFIVCLQLYVTMDFRLASYNLHGFNNRRRMLEALCNDNDFLFLQEY